MFGGSAPSQCPSCVWRVSTKPMSELCLEGQRNNAAVYKSSNLLEIVKKTKLKKQLALLDQVERERNLYKAIVGECKTTVQTNAAVRLGPSSPCSRDMMMHYSFDFAQQMHYPSPTRIDLFPHSQEMCLIWDDYGRHTSASELLDIRGYDHKLGSQSCNQLCTSLLQLLWTR